MGRIAVSFLAALAVSVLTMLLGSLVYDDALFWRFMAGWWSSQTYFAVMRKLAS